MNSNFIAIALVLLMLLPTALAVDNTLTETLEPLRNLSDFAESLDAVTRMLVLALSIGIFVISLKAYTKTKSQRFIFICLAFALFAVKWGLKVLDLFVSQGVFLPDTSENVFELLILASLFIALFKK